MDPNKVKSHALKHFLTTHVLGAGANLAVVKDWLGHADIRHTTIYAQLTTSLCWKVFATPARHSKNVKITIDQSRSTTAALKRYNRLHKTGIGIRQCKDLNNSVEQDHRAVKRSVRPRLGFK